MARYMVTRTLPPLSEEQLEEVGRKVVEACNEIEGMEWVRSHITSDGKHSFCEFIAPSAEACRAHAKRAGLPVDDVHPIGEPIGPRSNT
ncbi:MAG TPA: DUF4242 domain-containing protein [Thermoanaerobaculia bacterium]|nr:DUF4242 domain-containing protein [Thermoanaerobaculia bacterium]